MPLRVQCSAGHLMMVPDHRAGTVLRCANCGIDVQVPAAEGLAVKQPITPRINPPLPTRNEAKVSAGSKQSPQVAGHSTATPSGIGLPSLAKPGKPRIKATPVTTERKPAATAQQPSETVIVARQASAEASAKVATPANADAQVEQPATVPEIIFTTPVTAAPQPLAAPPLAADPAQVETVLLPPKKVAQPTAASKPTSSPVVPQPKESRQTLTGTVIVPREPVPPREELFEIRDEPSAPAQSFAEPPVAQPVTAEAVEPPPVAEAEPTPPPMIILQGVRPTASQRFTVWQLAAALAAAALLSIGPALWEIADYWRSDAGPGVARWAFLLLMLGVIQFAGIVLLIQVPDWSSVWVVTLQSLGLAAIYAAVLGLTIITHGNSSLISELQLDQYSSGSKTPPWCVCLAATYACLAFFAGRISSKWQKVLRQVQAADQAAAHI